MIVLVSVFLEVIADVLGSDGGSLVMVGTFLAVMVVVRFLVVIVSSS